MIRLLSHTLAPSACVLWVFSSPTLAYAWYVQPPALLEIARPAKPSPEARRNVGGIRARPEPLASSPMGLNVIHTTARHR